MITNAVSENWVKDYFNVFKFVSKSQVPVLGPKELIPL
jgi:hypothetical protein